MFSFLRKNIPISIVVIAYNKENYICECMDSILSQDIEKEIICINVEMLKQYCGVKTTKKSLENSYGKIDELTNTWNFVCNQAVSIFV